MFERLPNPDYWHRMVLHSSQAWRQRFAARPVGTLYGWDVWALDGKAFLFCEGKNYCRRADWFEFCDALRQWFKA